MVRRSFVLSTTTSLGASKEIPAPDDSSNFTQSESVSAYPTILKPTNRIERIKLIFILATRPIINHLPIHHCHYHFRVPDLHWIDREDVVGDDNEVSEFSRFESALHAVLKLRKRGTPREPAHGFFNCDLLFGYPAVWIFIVER